MRVKIRRQLDGETTEPLAGKWVQITTSQVGPLAIATMIGRVLAGDAGFLYVQHPNGDTLCLSRSAIRRLRVIELEPEGDAAVLLRASQAPDPSATLLRPARDSKTTVSELLLRPGQIP